MKKENPMYVRSLEKGMTVLNAFYGAGQYLRFSDIVKITGLSKSAVQRYIYTLEQMGFVRKNETTKQYCLTPKNLDCAYAYLESNPLLDIAVPHLIEARNRCNENVHLSFRDGLDLVYVFRAPSQKHTLRASLVGRRLPLFLLSGGRAMLSTLPDDEIKEIIAASDLESRTPYTEVDPERLFQSIVSVREEGFSMLVQEALMGEIAVAAPVVHPKFDLLAAVHIGVIIGEWTPERVLEELAPEVVRTARIISGYYD